MPDFNIMAPADGAWRAFPFPHRYAGRDIQKLLVKAWDFLISAVRAVGGLVGKAFCFFCQLVDQLLSYATGPLEALNQVLMAVLGSSGEDGRRVPGSIVEATSDASRMGVERYEGRSEHIGPRPGRDHGALRFGPGRSGGPHPGRTCRLSCYGATIISSVRVLKLPDGTTPWPARSPWRGRLVRGPDP